MPRGLKDILHYFMSDLLVRSYSSSFNPIKVTQYVQCICTLQSNLYSIVKLSMPCGRLNRQSAIDNKTSKKWREMGEIFPPILELN